MPSDQQHNPYVKIDYDQSEGMSRLQNNTKKTLLNNKLTPKNFEDKNSSNYLLKKQRLKYQLFKEHQEEEKMQNTKSRSPEKQPEMDKNNASSDNLNPFFLLNKKEIPSVFQIVDDINKEKQLGNTKDFSIIPSTNLQTKDKFEKLNSLLKKRKPVVTAASTMIEKDYHLLGSNLIENFDIFEVGSDEESLVENLNEISLLNNSRQTLGLMKKPKEDDEDFLNSLTENEGGELGDISFFPPHIDDNLSVKSNLSLSLELYKQSLEKNKIINDDLSEYSNKNASRSQLNLLSLTHSSNASFLLSERSGIPMKNNLLTNSVSSFTSPEGVFLIQDAKDDNWSQLIDSEVDFYNEDNETEDLDVDNDSLSLVPSPVLPFKIHKDDLEANIAQLKANTGVEVSDLDANNFNNKLEAHLHFLKNSKHNLKTLKSIIDMKALPSLEQLANTTENEVLPNYNLKNSHINHPQSSITPIPSSTTTPSKSPSEELSLNKVSSYLSPVKLIKSLVKNKEKQVNSSDNSSEFLIPSRPSTAEPNNYNSKIGNFINKLIPLNNKNSNDPKEDKDLNNLENFETPEKKKGILNYFENLLSKYTNVDETEYYDIHTIPFINRPNIESSPQESNFGGLKSFETNYVYKNDEEKLKDLQIKKINYENELINRQQFLSEHGKPTFIDPNQVDLTKPSDLIPIMSSNDQVKTINAYDFSLNHNKKIEESESIISSAEDILRIVEEELQLKHSNLYQASNEDLINNSIHNVSFNSPVKSACFPQISSSDYSQSPALTVSNYSSPFGTNSNNISPLPNVKSELSPVKVSRSKYFPSLSETDKNRPSYSNASLYQDDDEVSHATMTSFPTKPKSGKFKINLIEETNKFSVPYLSINSPNSASPLPTSTSINSLTPPSTINRELHFESQIFSESDDDCSQTPLTPISVNQIDESLSIGLSEKASEDLSRSLKNYPSLSKMIFKKETHNKDNKDSFYLPTINSPVKSNSVSSVTSSSSLFPNKYSEPFKPKIDIRDEIVDYLGSTNSNMYESYKEYYSISKGNNYPALLTNQTNHNEKIINPKKKLEDIMKKRYARDEEGVFENKKKAKQHLLDGYSKQTKINKEYLDLLEDW